MTYDEFKKYLLNGYRPPSETCQDGGYLVPETIMANKKGLLPKLYRWAGSMFSNRWLYRKGTYSFKLKESLEEIVRDGTI